MSRDAANTPSSPLEDDRARRIAEGDAAAAQLRARMANPDAFLQEAADAIIARGKRAEREHREGAALLRRNPAAFWQQVESRRGQNAGTDVSQARGIAEGDEAEHRAHLRFRHERAQEAAQADEELTHSKTLPYKRAAVGMVIGLFILTSVLVGVFVTPWWVILLAVLAAAAVTAGVLYKLIISMRHPDDKAAAAVAQDTSSEGDAPTAQPPQVNHHSAPQVIPPKNNRW